MRGFGSRGWRFKIAVISLLGLSACGGHKPPGPSPFPARVNLNPAGAYSVTLGSYFGFTASANNSSNGGVGATFTYTSSDTSILNVAPNGVACAGHWDAAFATCTPGNTGIVQVTASALGANSQPTFVFVHQPIDNIVVKGILQTGIPIQEPCLSQSQTMTVQAYAYSQGADITSSVGPFTWSANNTSVVKLVPIVTPFISNNQTFYIATNQATATAVTPGITQIYATASNVFSTTFQQPNLNAPNPAPITFDFFETCPIQNITLELGPAGSQQNGQTSFISPKGATQIVTPILTDVMGNSSLPNPNSQIVLSKIPLTWTASQPGVVATTTNCATATCTITTPSAGAGTVTASCSPPTCNVGFPEVPPALTPASLATCASYVKTLQFGLTSCEQFIPLPVYSTVPITGIVTGAPGTTTAVASSVDCQNEPSNPNPICTTSIYSISTSKAAAGTATPMPSSPNSLLFDLAGDRAYIGSNFGALTLSPANLNSSNQAFASLGAVEGTVLAVSPNGNSAIFSNPGGNEVFIAGSGAPIVLTIFNASTAAFSPDGLKAFIFGFDTNQNPTLYIYSTQEALQAIQLPANTTVNSIAFSDNGAFAYVAEPNLGSLGGPAVTVYNICNNQVATGLNSLNQIVPQTIPLSNPPVTFKALQDGVHFVALGENGNIDYITATVTGIPAAKLGSPATSICPMTVAHTNQTFNLQRGSIHPINIFASADGSQFYIAASDSASILVYSFDTRAVTGILLQGNATPLSADISVDSSTIMVAGSDGQLHEITTANGGNDVVQIQFPPLPNYLNPFCTFNPSGPCKFDLMAVRP